MSQLDKLPVSNWPRSTCLDKMLNQIIWQENALPEAVAGRLPNDNVKRSFTGECPHRGCRAIGTLVCRGRRPLASETHGECAEFGK